MEEKLQKEKEEKEADKEAALKNIRNEVDDVPSGSEDKHEAPTAVESPPEDDRITYTPGPIRVPVEDVTENSILVSDLPPIPETDVEQERLEMIEINNDGNSGHLTHSL